jgi:hypothetical protein
MTLSGFSPLRNAAKATPTGKHLSFSAWLRLAAVERIQRETETERLSMKYVVLDQEGSPTPGSPFPDKESAEAAVAKRLSHDLRVNHDTTYEIAKVS